MADQIGDDPELLAKVTPAYPPFGKRMLQDNGSWLAALKRENVDLVTTGISEIAPTGVRCADGTQHPVDVIVLATGFHANRYLWPMEIVGRRGVGLRERWGDEMPLEVHALRLGDDTAIVTLPGEIFTELGKRIAAKTGAKTGLSMRPDQIVDLGLRVGPYGKDKGRALGHGTGA